MSPPQNPRRDFIDAPFIVPSPDYERGNLNPRAVVNLGEMHSLRQNTSCRVGKILDPRTSGKIFGSHGPHANTKRVALSDSPAAVWIESNVAPAFGAKIHQLRVHRVEVAGEVSRLLPGPEGPGLHRRDVGRCRDHHCRDPGCRDHGVAHHFNFGLIFPQSQFGQHITGIGIVRFHPGIHRVAQLAEDRVGVHQRLHHMMDRAVAAGACLHHRGR